MESAEKEAGKSKVSNRRKFQIVQKSPFVPDWNREHNDAVCPTCLQVKFVSVLISMPDARGKKQNKA
jgi:hypothetical protein